jgi:hypothetical protein
MILIWTTLKKKRIPEEKTTDMPNVAMIPEEPEVTPVKPRRKGQEDITHTLKKKNTSR